jgi:hypothetical protein
MNPSQPTHTKQTVIAWAAILLLGCLLRLLGLGQESYWYDEVHSVLTANQESISAILRKLKNDVHPPLYFIFLHGWIQIAGISETATRLFSALCSCGVMLALYAWGRALRLPSRAIQLGILFFALSPHAIWYAQQVRMYSFEILLGTIHLFCTTLAFRLSFHEAIQRKGRTLALLTAWIITGCALLWTHFYGLFFLLFDGIWAILRGTQAWNQARQCQSATARQRFWTPIAFLLLPIPIWMLSFYPLVMQLSARLSTGHGFNWVSSYYQLSWSTPYDVLANLLTGHRVLLGPDFLRIALVLCFLVFMGYGITTFLSLIKNRNINQDTLNRWIPCISAFCLLLLPLLVSLWKPITLGGYRYLIIALPSLCLASGLGFHAMLSAGRTTKYLGILFFLGIAAYQLTAVAACYLEREPPLWREGLHEIASRVEPGDLILPVSPHTRPVTDYYNNSDGKSCYIEDVFSLSSPPKHVWLITPHAPYTWQERILHAAGYSLTEILHKQNNRYGTLIRVNRFDWMQAAHTPLPTAVLSSQTKPPYTFQLFDFIEPAYGLIDIDPQSQAIASLADDGTVTLSGKPGIVTYHIKDREKTYALHQKVHKIETGAPQRFFVSLFANEPIQTILDGDIEPNPSLSFQSIHLQPNPAAGNRIIRQTTTTATGTADLMENGLRVRLKERGELILERAEPWNEPRVVTLANRQITIIPAERLSLIPQALLPVDRRPLGHVDIQNHVLIITTQPGEAAQVVLDPRPISGPSILELHYKQPTESQTAISMIGYQTQNEYDALNNQIMTFTTVQNSASNQNNPIRCSFSYDLPWVSPAIQILNDGNQSVSVQIEQITHHHGYPAFMYAHNPNHKAPITPSGYFPITKMIAQPPVTFDFNGFVTKPLTAFPILNNNGQTKGHVRATVNNHARVREGIGSLSLQPAGSQPEDAANAFLSTTLQPGHYVARLALKRLTGTTGVIDVVITGKDGATNTTRTIPLEKIPSDHWKIFEMGTWMPEKTECWIVVQAEGGDATVAIDDIEIRQADNNDFLFYIPDNYFEL